MKDNNTEIKEIYEQRVDFFVLSECAGTEQLGRFSDQDFLGGPISIFYQQSDAGIKPGTAG